ncbi:hypothetical protein GUJ93_ZPchr0011g26893 [Zizania palustris]|uniref:Uncharacterized protein n=1 Tax=Zizania palustris TaxID=103762 RepID=A0A8J5WLS8_ZIZPA|nr:hypothetical protein GUJ93_ZPchr0011g26893 [Zizania palustris]
MESGGSNAPDTLTEWPAGARLRLGVVAIQRLVHGHRLTGSANPGKDKGKVDQEGHGERGNERRKGAGRGEPARGDAPHEGGGSHKNGAECSDAMSAATERTRRMAQATRSSLPGKAAAGTARKRGGIGVEAIVVGSRCRRPAGRTEGVVYPSEFGSPSSHVPRETTRRSRLSDQRAAQSRVTSYARQDEDMRRPHHSAPSSSSMQNLGDAAAHH